LIAAIYARKSTDQNVVLPTRHPLPPHGSRWSPRSRLKSWSQAAHPSRFSGRLGAGGHARLRLHAPSRWEACTAPGLLDTEWGPNGDRRGGSAPSV